MPNAVAIASETRGLRRSDRGEGATLFVIVVGRFVLGSLIRFGFFRFRFVHHGDGYFVFSHRPVTQVALAAARAAEREFGGRFQINGLFANGAL
jgi:hypothetical protein